MKKNKSLLLSLLFGILFLSVSCASSAKKEGKIFKTSFEGNLSDGVLWQCDSPKNCLKLVNVEYKLDGDGKDAKGIYSFYFSPLEEGTEKLRFYRSNLNSIDKIEEELLKDYSVKAIDNTLTIVEQEQEQK